MLTWKGPGSLSPVLGCAQHHPQESLEELSHVFVFPALIG